MPENSPYFFMREFSHEELANLLINKVKELKGELDEHRAALPLLYEHWDEATELN